MDLSLVGSQMSSDALCEESLVREGVDYDEAFGSGDEFEDFSPSSKRERRWPNLPTAKLRVTLRGLRR